MSIHVRDPGDNAWKKIQQPYVKDSNSGIWTPCKKVFVKDSDNVWKEVWPNSLIYIHTGYGYNLNIEALFKQLLGQASLSKANYIFINQGYIGGYVGGNEYSISLDTGNFPTGSTLTVINQGYISGVGGDGGSFYRTNGGTEAHPTSGGVGFAARFPTFVDNSLGYIQGGGGGGGATGDFAGKHWYHARGGGGAGLPVGRNGVSVWGVNDSGHRGFDYGPTYPASISQGASNFWGEYTGGSGGNPGVAGLVETRIINDDLSKMTMASPPGAAIVYGGNILTGSIGLGSDRVFGRISSGYPDALRLGFAGFAGGTNYGQTLKVNLIVEGAGANVSAEWVWVKKTSSNTAMLGFTKVSNSQFNFNSIYKRSYTPGQYRTNYWVDGVVRFTLTSAQGTDSFDLYVRVGAGQKDPPPGSVGVGG